MPAKSNAEWKLWGENDPLFGVSSWVGRGRGDDQPWTDDEFYALGASDWADFRRHWESYGVEPGTCVEVGCGAARLTRPMAQFFEHVHGVDVASGMLEKAEAAVADLPVTLHLSDGLTLPLGSGTADAVLSTHVFQHLDTAEDLEANWREIARVLRPGGTFLIHLPVHVWPGGLERLQGVYNARRRLGDLRAARERRRMEAGKRPPIMRGQSSNWDELELMLRELGFVGIELRIFRVTSNDGRHPIVLGRKAG